MLKFLKLALLLSLSAGCVVSPITPMDLTERKVIDFPEVDKVITTNLGETLVTKGIRTTGKALEVTKLTTFGKKAGEASIMTCGLTVNPASQFYRGRWQQNEEMAACYGPFNAQVTLSDGSTNFNCLGQYIVGDICQDEQTDDFFLALLSIKHPLEQDQGNLAVVDKIVTSQTNFVQELIYNGRSGDTLRFIYRELSDNLLRAAFSQDIQYDLSKSTEIGFKGVRIEVIEASNTNITYKMLSNF